MIATSQPLGSVLLAFCITAEIFADLGFKRSADSAMAARRFVRGLASNPVTWATLLLSVCEIIAWILVLQRVRLSIAYPVMSLVYAGVPMAGALVLRERLTRQQVLGTVAISIGVTCVTVFGSR